MPLYLFPLPQRFSIEDLQITADDDWPFIMDGSQLAHRQKDSIMLICFLGKLQVSKSALVVFYLTYKY